DCGRPGSASSRGGIVTFFFQDPSIGTPPFLWYNSSDTAYIVCRAAAGRVVALRGRLGAPLESLEPSTRGGASMGPASRPMGRDTKRKEDPRLVTGTSAYVGDITLPGLHHVAFVRSPHAHARIRRIDAAAALRRPGVRAVFTGGDIEGRCAPLPLAGGGEGGQAAAAA